MGIAILGWGSLIWDPRDLLVQGDWIAAGPVLPIEFSRISQNKRLTLVIDERAGVDVRTRYILSSLDELSDAIENLRKREGAIRQGIGVFDTSGHVNNEHAKEVSPIAFERINSWAKGTGLDAVIWTALSPKFLEGKDFSVASAILHLASLQEPERTRAFDYIHRAPAEVVTPLRTAFTAEFG